MQSGWPPLPLGWTFKVEVARWPPESVSITVLAPEFPNGDPALSTVPLVPLQRAT